ncbi:MAG: CvpA family protein [bacterium]
MILDLVIIFFIIISIIFGYKVGFVKYILKIASILSGLLISILLTSPCTDLVMKTPIGSNIVETITQNITKSNIDLSSANALPEMLEAAGVPSFLTGIISSMLGNPEPADMINSISTFLSEIIISTIVFFILLFGATLIIFILKKIADRLRESKVFKFIDGIFGIVFSLLVFTLILFVVSAGLIVALNISFIEESIGSFITTQLDSSFGLFKYFYQNNIIVNIWNLIF